MQFVVAEEAALKSRLMSVLKQTFAALEDSETGGCNPLNPPTGSATGRVDMWKSCAVDAVISDDFASTGGCKVLRGSLLCRKKSVT